MSMSCVLIIVSLLHLNCLVLVRVPIDVKLMLIMNLKEKPFNLLHYCMNVDYIIEDIIYYKDAVNLYTQFV